ncbi:MAG: carbamoyl-phosphate synthase large subunit [Candidatus Aminicenantes bacterium]|nr:carbamoyl-phosphate synthase large subunit [Candidatus Aminicenantes bacterium]MBL7082040.1 carbamoyl-phosphate synthase large subunit [Candidatus Aminicenantes bacterium]
MPKRKDIKSILIIGSGPIIIGQASEFDYSGTQALKALKEEQYKVILLNSNPATIMTDPEFADRTYLEPLTVEYLEKIIQREKPDALLATLGGQKALNLALELDEKGILDKHKIQLIGVSTDSIRKAEDRMLFRKSMEKIGLEVPESGYASSMKEAVDIVKRIKFPVVLRPSFTLGGTGGNIIKNWEDFYKFLPLGLAISPITKVLIEKSIIGWKEFELEVMRDKKDNVVIVCAIENFDPMGVHTGDSITVAPAQTLTDKEYQRLRDASIAIMREIGVETGGSNIQFAINPSDGRMMVVEMNPRVSRSSALASKATGFPIAKMAAKLAVGYTLDEILNDITKKTPACFEPAIDYVVVKIPRFAFEKFPEEEPALTTQMKSVGETMAIGRTFKEALQKAIRSLEIDKWGFEEKYKKREQIVLKEDHTQPNAERIWYIADALRKGISVNKIYKLTQIDPFFLQNIKDIVNFEEKIKSLRKDSSNFNLLQRAKELGFSDKRIGELAGLTEDEVRKLREKARIYPVWKVVDTCAGEFESETPYFYSTYEEENEVPEIPQKKVIILGSGPNRIGQGIEFDYCCVHGVFALRDSGYKAIMINSNPETVSTDYDISDRLYFDPVTLEDVLSIYRNEKPEGIIVQFGGQTPLKISIELWKNKVKILGTSSQSIDETEDREKFDKFLTRLNLQRPRNGMARNSSQALKTAENIGYPVLVRPSYVLGGRAMKVIHNEEELEKYVKSIQEYCSEYPILIDEFIDNAIELDVDILCDGQDVYIGGILEHIQEAGIHSGDATMVTPPYFIADRIIEEVKRQVTLMAKELQILGLMNVQVAVKGTKIYILEVNPRASRTVPFLSKATGVPLAKIATQLIMGEKLRDMNITRHPLNLYAVKEAVFSFDKFMEVDPILGPEMRSTGESIGIDTHFPLAFLKAQEGAGFHLPQEGNIFVSAPDEDKPKIIPIVEKLEQLGFNLVATEGTTQYLRRHGFRVDTVGKVYKEKRNILEEIKEGKVGMIFNSPSGTHEISDAHKIRKIAFAYRIPCYTTIPSASAAVKAIEMRRKTLPSLLCLQDIHSNSIIQ